MLLLDGAADLSLDLLGGLLAGGLGHGQAHRGILGGAARLVHGQTLQPITGQYSPAASARACTSASAR